MLPSITLPRGSYPSGHMGEDKTELPCKQSDYNVLMPKRVQSLIVVSFDFCKEQFGRDSFLSLIHHMRQFISGIMEFLTSYSLSLMKDKTLRDHGISCKRDHQLLE